MIEIKTLGAFRVIVDGVDRTPSAGKPRTVLAMLAFHYNRLVTVEAIIDELWDSRPPRTAMTTLQTYIWQLRKTFNEADENFIETLPGGYVLRIPPEAMDIWVFERLCSDGRKAAANGRLEAAAELLDEALRCWRGPVISDISTGERLEALKAYWHETWLSARQLRIDLGLRLGRHHELLGELTEMAASYPLDEKASWMLMLALYRCGRQADALAAYQRIRQHMVRELAIDPSPSLCELHQRILGADPELDFVPESADVPQRAPVFARPAQLPPDTAAFVGRHELLEVLGAALVSADDPACVPTVSLIGPAGVGKSSLAIHLGHQVKEHFPDGQIYVDLSGTGEQPLDPLQALNSMLFALGIDPRTVPGGVDIRASLFRSCSSERRLLIVLDNAASAQQVRPLLPNGPSCGVIITGRALPYGLPSSHVATVNPLDEAQSLAVLAAAVPGPGVIQDRETAKAIVRECRGIPRVLNIIATFAAAHPHFGLAEALRMLRARGTEFVDLNDLGGHDQYSLLSCLAAVTEALL